MGYKDKLLQKQKEVEKSKYLELKRCELEDLLQKIANHPRCPTHFLKSYKVAAKTTNEKGGV